jgi:hypothetical protein
MGRNMMVLTASLFGRWACITLAVRFLATFSNHRSLPLPRGIVITATRCAVLAHRHSRPPKPLARICFLDWIVFIVLTDANWTFRFKPASEQCVAT